MKWLLLLANCLTSILVAYGQIINRNPGFENGDWLNEWRDSNVHTVEDTLRGIEIDSLLTRSGQYALKLYHKDFYRCEIVSKEYIFNEDTIIAGQFEFFKEYWLGVSIYLKDWNSNPSFWNTLLQTHTVPNNGDWMCGSGNNGMSIATKYNSVEGNKLQIHATIIDDPMTAISESSGVGPIVWEIPCPENQWMDFVFNFKYSYNEDGFIKVWYNGIKIIDISGPNIHYLDRCGLPRSPIVNLKLGSYKERTSFNYREMYVDEVQIGGVDSNYDEVAPANGVLINNSPELLSSIGDLIIRERESINLELYSIDQDGDSLFYYLSEEYDFVFLHDNLDGTATLTFSPLNGHKGIYDLAIMIIDSNFGIDLEEITISIREENALPTLEPVRSWRLKPERILNLFLKAYDSDGDEIAFSLFPEDMGFISLTDNKDGTGILHIAPNTSETGVHKLTIIATDSFNGSDSEIISILVEETDNNNATPYLDSISDHRIFEDETHIVELSATDSDNDPMNYKISPKNEFISLVDNNDGTAKLYISPKRGNAGIYNPVISVFDVKNNYDTKAFTLIVDDLMNPTFSEFINSGGIEINYGSVLAKPDQYFEGGSTFTINDSIKETVSAELYLSERYGWNFLYNIPVPEEGEYSMRLHFAEVEYINGSVGSRIFNVIMENGQKSLINFDINAEIGPLIAYIKTFTGINVEDNYMSLNFESVVGNAKISAIEVLSEKGLVTSIYKFELLKQISIHPNPSNGLFKIEIPQEYFLNQKPMISILTITGKIIHQTQVQSKITEIDLSNKKQGMYFLKIYDFYSVIIII